MVSIVICTREYDSKLLECLESLRKQDLVRSFAYRPVSLFNNAFLKKAKLEECLDIIIETEGSIVEARKRGIEKARGEYICLVDSDQVLTDPHTLRDCIKICDSLGYDGVTWTERGLNPSTFCEKVIDYDKQLFHEAQDDDPIKGAAEPRFFKAKFLKNLDFRRLPPITFELSMINKQVNDMGAKIAFTDKVVYHHEPKTFRELFKKFFRYGYYYIPSLKYSKELVIRHSLPRRVYFRLTSFRRPLLYVGLWFHYLVKGIATLGGVIWYLLLRALRVRTQVI